MIRFIKATKLLGPSSARRKSAFVLQHCTAAVSTSSIANINAGNDEVRTAFLELLYGSVKLESGMLLRDGVRFSPIINLGGGSGLLIPTLTVRENIHYQARLSHADAKIITDFVVSVCDEYAPVLNAAVGKAQVPVGGALLAGGTAKLAFPMRRVLEAAIVMAAPYHCYLADQFELLPDIVRSPMHDLARRRGAGLIFATGNPAVARMFGESTISLRDGKIFIESLQDQNEIGSA